MWSIQGVLQQAVAHHQAGRLGEAERLYRQVLSFDAANPDALQLLGVVQLQAGNAAEAVDLIRRSLKRRPDDAQAHYNLGNALRAHGDAANAVSAFRRAIKLAPRMADAHGNLGALLAQTGRGAEAVGPLREAVRLAPGHAAAWANLASALRDQREWTEAVSCYETALKLDPNAQAPRLGLSIARGELQRSATAGPGPVDPPADPAALINLTASLRSAGRLHEALETGQRAVRAAPDSVAAHYNLGLVLCDFGHWADAEAALQRSVALQPTADGFNNLGLALQGRDRWADAITAHERALAIEPRHARAAANLGTALLVQGRHAAALAAFDRALAADPGLAAARSNQLMTRVYMPQTTPAAFFAAAQAWDRAHGSASAARHANSREPDRRLRLGYVSADFRLHSCAWFLEPLLRAHDRAQVDVVCFSGSRDQDAVTARFRQVANGWYETVGLGDRDLADLIVRERIDILVDCSGHTAGNRLPALALRPAPVQVTWLGFPATTGLTAIDYRLTDAIADPPEADALSSERPWRLPQGFLSYGPPQDAPPVAPPPSAQAGHVTFGSFNNPAKLNADVASAWARIIAAVPASRLMLKAQPFADPATAARFRDLFAAAGLDVARLDLLPGDPSLAAHLARYGAIDIALDPFPYNGTTTTCEALWMGVPVVTLCGDRHAGRVGASLLTHVGRPDLIASDVADYIRIAATIAHDGGRLAQGRSAMRSRLADSPLIDAAGFARALEGAYRDMWRTWCRSA